MSWASPLFITN